MDFLNTLPTPIVIILGIVLAVIIIGYIDKIAAAGIVVFFLIFALIVIIIGIVVFWFIAKLIIDFMGVTVISVALIVILGLAAVYFVFSIIGEAL